MYRLEIRPKAETDFARLSVMPKRKLGRSSQLKQMRLSNGRVGEQ